MERFILLFRYIRYFFRSGNEHSIHSPFVFDLYLQAIKPQKQFYIFQEIEKLRKELLSSNKKIHVTDFGAGSKVTQSNERSISSIVRNAEKPARLAQLIFRLIEYTKPTMILDLGTSLGLTTIYEAKADKTAKVLTFEGCPETARIALENFQKLNINNITLIQGNIDTTLPETLTEISKVDFVFFDANHRYEPTLRYFKECLKKSHEDSLFVFDDIHWSNEMEKAWEEIKQHPDVTLTIDLFFIGLVFFRKKHPKQHFILRR